MGVPPYPSPRHHSLAALFIPPLCRCLYSNVFFSLCLSTPTCPLRVSGALCIRFRLCMLVVPYSTAVVQYQTAVPSEHFRLRTAVQVSTVLELGLLLWLVDSQIDCGRLLLFIGMPSQDMRWKGWRQVHPAGIHVSRGKTCILVPNVVKAGSDSRGKMTGGRKGASFFFPTQQGTCPLSGRKYL